MNAKDALNHVEKLFFSKTGEYLNDLEREVFIGSWEGKTYEEIDGYQSDYLEKYVGYRLWRKLSPLFQEKVSKKKIKGAVERWISHRKHVFISHVSQQPDFDLAIQLRQALCEAQHRVFMANMDEACNSACHPNVKGGNWLAQIDAELEQCQYFLLLLSPQAAVSEMVIEELRRVREFRSLRHDYHPVILTIQWQGLTPKDLNHDLRNYLQGTQKREWDSGAYDSDAAVATAQTSALIQDILIALDQPFGSSLVGWHDWEVLDLEPSSDPPSVELKHQGTPPPLPVAEPELQGGQVRLNSRFYVERNPSEAQCYREILRPGALIRVKAPRQMGKTSLMARILSQAREQGYQTATLNFQHADEAVFENLSQLLQWFCAKVARKLRLPHKVHDRWTDTYGSKDNCTIYFEDCLLPEMEGPLVLGLDEVDRVFQYPLADDFFGLLRAWYEEAGYSDSDSELWAKLRLVVVHSTEVYIPLDVNQSPFNVGLPIELEEFDAAQMTDLAQRYGLRWDPPQIQSLRDIVGGHPYLVRVALYHLAQAQLTLSQLSEIAPTEAGLYGDHLRRHLWNLRNNRELGQAFSQVVNADDPVELDSTLAFKLHSLGLVKLQGNEVTPRFELYRRYFCDRPLT